MNTFGFKIPTPRAMPPKNAITISGLVKITFCIILQYVTTTKSVNTYRPKLTEQINYDYKCEVNFPDDVRCTANGTYYDLKLEFEHIAQTVTNQTYFQRVWLSNDMFTEIPEDVFSGIRFGEIRIAVSSNLTRIHKNAFKSTANTTNSFTMAGETRLRNSPPDYDLYYALSTLTNATRIELSLDPTVEHEIPDNAFSNVNGVQSSLEYIYFSSIMYLNISRKFVISRIGNNAFNLLPNVRGLVFIGTTVKSIASKAFDFSTTSDNISIIQLTNCNLTHESFEDNVFSGSRPPIFLSLGNSSIEYIDEKTFSSFIAANGRHFISFDGNALNCTDITRFQWLLVQKQQLENRVINARCSDGRNLWDLEIPINTSTTPITNTTESSGNRATNYFYIIFISLICVSLIALKSLSLLA